MWHFKFFITSIYIILFLLLYNVIYLYKLLSICESYVDINKYFKNLKKRKCLNKSFEKKISCYDMKRNILNLTYNIVSINVERIINFGKRIIINKRKNIITAKQKLINESFKIFFINEVYVNEYGSILTNCNEYLSLKGGCRCKLENTNIYNTKNYSTYNNVVFQITQYLGSSIYHSVINCLTKLIPIYNTLFVYPNSKIHIHNSSAILNYLNMLNIGKERIITGSFLSKKLVIMDRVECTSSIYTYSLIQLRQLLLKKVNKMNIVHKNEDTNTKRTLLIIKRLYSRKIKNFDELLFFLCNSYNFTCFIYHPNVQFYKMIYMFSTANIIFGPHGAGFTNILVSMKTVKIFELIKSAKPVLCFATLANILGYLYYGIYFHYNDIREEFNINLTYMSIFFNDFLLL